VTPDESGTIRTIPLVDVGRRGAVGLYEAVADEAKDVIVGALGAHPVLARVAPLGDRMSRRWLERRANPFLGEIAEVSRAIGLPGVYLLNIVYEWACSTSSGPAPEALGNRMIRVLDWGMPGIGCHVVIGRHESDFGDYFNAAWPGYAGVLTGMAPGRFSAAINQAPRQTPTGLRWLDEAIVHLAMYRASDTIPAAHLMRLVFERAPDYAAAVAMLMDESVPLAMPALFTLSGVALGEGCVIEAIGRRRVLNRATPANGNIVGVANAWLSTDLPGTARDNALAWSTNTTVEANNAERRDRICQLQRGRFGGTTDLVPPVLNGHTILVATANARAGTFAVEALDQAGDLAALPRVVAQRTIEAQPSPHKAATAGASRRGL
jgi:hypothetical protein